jgi:hypothetical protein
MGDGAFFTSPSTRSLASPPRDAMAALARTHGRGSTHSWHPGRRKHATVQGEVLCAHNGTQQHQMHRMSLHSSEQLLRSMLQRSRTRSDPSDDGSAIAHARTAPHMPHLHNIAQLCIMSAQHVSSLPHTAAHLHDRNALREHGDAVRHTHARAAKAPTPHAAARQRRRFARRSTRRAFRAT